MIRSSHTLCSLLIASMIFGVGCKSKPDANKSNDSAQLIKESQTQTGGADSARRDASVEAARVALEAAKYREAARAYEQAIEGAPESWELYMDLAIARAKVPDFLGAVEAISVAMEKGGREDWRTWYTLGNIYQNRGLYHESTKAYRVALGLQDEAHVPTLVNLASGYIFLRRFDEARQTLDYTLTLAPNEVRVAHNMALLDHMQDDFKRALQGYDGALALEPEFAQSHYNRADVLMELKRYDEASAGYTRYTELEPDGPYVERARQKVIWIQQNRK